MNVREIVEEYLLTHGFDGLVNLEVPCGCVIGKLAPCEECFGFEWCKAGYVHYCDTCPPEIQFECQVESCPHEGGYCVSPEKEMKVREPNPPPEPWIIDAKLQDMVEFRDRHALEMVNNEVEWKETSTGIVKMIARDHHILRCAVQGQGRLVKVDSKNFIRIIKYEPAKEEDDNE